MSLAPSPPPPLDGPPRCGRCQQVIGVYEPAVTIAGGRARRTSRAADPELLRAATGGAEHYHLACYEPHAGEFFQRR
ncbi:MAG: hypothetical protein ACRDMJ_03875 [Solirubrobacteraceae bacterium]